MPRLSAELIEQAARVDPDRTLAAGFLEEPARSRCLALVLFQSELARAREAASEPALAAIRLQWWREAIDELYAGAPARRHPVVQALSETIAEASLPRALIDTMIDARDADLEACPFPDWPALEAHSDDAAGTLIRLQSLACGLPALSTPLDEAARHAGVAWTLAALMRASAAWVARGARWWPQSEPDLRTALRHGMARVEASVRAARLAMKPLPASVFPAFAPVCLARRFARASVRLSDPASQIAAVPLLERQVRMVVAVALERL